MEPGLVAGSGVWTRRFVDEQSVMDVVPIVGCCVGRIDVERLDGIDQLQDSLYLGPSRQPQQALTTGRDPGHRRIALSRRRRAQNIDARKDGPKVVGRPT